MKGGTVAAVIGAGVLGATVLGVALVRCYLNRKWGTCTNNYSLQGKTFIVTGANSGIGLETAKALLRRHARVVFACRDTNAAMKVVNDFKAKENITAEIVILNLDLSSFESIKEFIKLVKANFNKIDCLINNAGVYVPVEMNKKTVEGFEINLGVNHLGHFLLTKLLISSLEKAAPSKVVIVSSTLHQQSQIDLSDMNLEKVFEAIKTADKKTKKKLNGLGYNNSKMMNVHFGRALAERLKDKNIDVYMVCPGFTYTNLFRNAIKWYHFIIMLPVFLFFMRSASKGAQTVLYCATEKELEGHTGNFYRDCKPFESKKKPNRELEDLLWNWSDRCVTEGRMVPVKM